MINATKKWIFLKVSGATLVPLMIWFILNFINIYNQGYLVVENFFNSTSNNFIASKLKDVIFNLYLFKKVLLIIKILIR